MRPTRLAAPTGVGILITVSTPPDSPYDVPSSSRSEAPLPGFWERLVRLPFSPSLWQRSADAGFPEVLLPLLVLAFAANLALGWMMVPRLKEGVYQAADYYEENADPLVYQDGRFRLDGERILHYDDGEFTLLVDPEWTVPDEAVTTLQYLVVRADEVTFKQAGRARESYVVEEFAALLGPGPLVLDAQTVRDLADAWIPPVIISLMAFGGTLGELVGCFFYALIAGLLILLLRGQWLALGFPACYRVALATSSVKIVLGFTFAATQTPTILPGIVLWPAVMTALGLIALVRRPAPLRASAP